MVVHPLGEVTANFQTSASVMVRFNFMVVLINMADKFLTKDETGKWNTIPPIPADKIQNVNCHKFILYVIGRIPWEEMISDPQTQKDAASDFTFGDKARSISDAPFSLMTDLKSLYSLMDTSCGSEKSYIGQILDAETGEMAHSFILERDQSGSYICFDKPGFKYPFSVHALEDIYNFVNKDGVKSYQNQKWRFVPMKTEK